MKVTQLQIYLRDNLVATSGSIKTINKPAPNHAAGREVDNVTPY